MQMTDTQARSLRHLTNRVTQSAQMSKGEWLNGPVIFQAENVAGGAIMVSAFNVDYRWFETHCFALWFIGPRGGIELRHCEGFHKPAMEKIKR